MPLQNSNMFPGQEEENLCNYIINHLLNIYSAVIYMDCNIICYNFQYLVKQ